MKTQCQETLTVKATPDDAFQAALGVVQNTKNFDILAVHVEGRQLVARKKPKTTNAKIFVINVTSEMQGQATINLVVDIDPRMRKAIIDGKVNKKSAGNYLEAVQGALNGSAPAPASPVKNHFMQKKEQVPWTDPSQDPDIQMGFSWVSFAHSMGH